MTSGEPYPRAGFEFAPATAAECAQQAVETFVPELITAGSNIEERYLDDDYVHSHQSNSFSLRSVAAAIRDHERIGTDALETLTGESSVARIGEEAEAARKTLMEAFLDRGEELGITEELPSPYEDEGWRLDLGPEGPVAAYVSPSPQGVRLRVVNLDALFVSDPDFVREQIRRFHVARATWALATRVQITVGYHELAASDLLPGLLRDIVALPPDEQESTKNNILTFSGATAVLPSMSDQLRKFRQSLLEAGGNQTTHDVLQHMSECGTQPEDVQAQARTLRSLYAGLAELRLSTGLMAGVSEERLRWLETPYSVLPKYQEGLERAIQNQIERARNDAAFVESVRLLYTPEALLSALELSWPDTYNLYTQLSDYLAEGHKMHHLTAILAGTALALQLRRRAIDPDTVLATLCDKLQLGLNTRGPVEGVRLGHDRNVIFTDHRLETALLLLVSKHAQKEIADSASRRPSLTELSNRATVTWRTMEALLENQFSETAEGAIAHLERVREDFQEAERFRQDIELTDEDVEWLSVLVDEENEHELVDIALFDTVFHALMLDRQNLIDMRSRGFIAFLHNLLAEQGELPASRAEGLRRLGLE